MKTQTFTLPNNLRVVLVDTGSFPSLTTLLLVGAGSRYETSENNGIAHFMEHMAFKGSAKYPTTQVIASTVEGLGGIFNAFTGKDHTGYWIKSPTQHFDKTLSILADMIQQPLLKKEEIGRERGVIIEEINMYEDAPQRLILDIYEGVAFPKTALGMPITGTKQTVSRFTRSTFTAYLRSLYKPSNAVLVVAGGLKNGSNKSYRWYRETIAKRFKKWEDGKTISFKPVVLSQKKPVVFVREKKTEQVHFCLGFRTFSFFDERRYVVSVLAAVLGQGMSSRLFSEVRERRGLCYYIHTYNDEYHDTGTILTHAGVRAKASQVKEAIEVILHEHRRIANGDITDREFTIAKEYIKGSFLLSLEDTFDVAAFFGRDTLLEKKIKSPTEALAAVDAVEKSEIIRLAADIFIPKNLNLALIGSIPDSAVDKFASWSI